jgi:hypothetical protein
MQKGKNRVDMRLKTRTYKIVRGKSICDDCELSKAAAELVRIAIMKTPQEDIDRYLKACNESEEKEK